jgi:hypothetical protein
LVAAAGPGTDKSIPPSSKEEGGGGSSSSGSGSSSAATFRKERGRDTDTDGKKDREERVIIVDLNETGDGVVSASSLSAGWQILSASLSSAPTFDTPSSADAEHEDDSGERGLMLRIEGTGISVGGGDEDLGREGLGIREKGTKGGGSTVLGEEELQGLLEGFDRKMGVLRKIVGEGWGGLGGDVGMGMGIGEEKGDEGLKGREV